MKYLIGALIAVLVAGTAVAGTLPNNSGGKPIQVPTGIETKGKSDVVIKSGHIVQETKQEKINRRMLDKTKLTNPD